MTDTYMVDEVETLLEGIWAEVSQEADTTEEDRGVTMAGGSNTYC